MKAWWHSLHLIWKILLILIAAAILAFCVLLGFVCIREGQVPRDPDSLKADYDAIIVLGAQVKPDGTPSVQLTWRLDAAFSAWQKKNVPIIVCGAQGKDEPETEASAMQRYLEEKGVPASMILADPDSFNTEQNLAHAKELLSKVPGENNRVLIVTSDYHVPRAMALAGDMGLTASGLGSPCLQEYWIKNHGREVLAWCKYWLNKYFHMKL